MLLAISPTKLIFYLLDLASYTPTPTQDSALRRELDKFNDFSNFGLNWEEWAAILIIWISSQI